MSPSRVAGAENTAEHSAKAPFLTHSGSSRVTVSFLPSFEAALMGVSRKRCAVGRALDRQLGSETGTRLCLSSLRALGGSMPPSEPWLVY